MEEQKYRTSPKTSFLLGLLAGLAVIGLTGFFFTLPKALTCSEVNKNTAMENNNVNDNKVGNVNSADKAAPTQPTVDASKLSPIKDSEYIKGSKAAKVSVIEFSDFECPYCAKHATTINQVIKEYGDNIKLVFRHFPLSFHPNAQKAAEAVECAGEQGRFWDMHDKIFEANRNKEMGIDKWKEVAKELGLDFNKFNNCLDAGKYESKVKSDFQEGQAVGVRGTPATFINSEMISGAVPFEQLKQAIDKNLK